MNYPDSNDLYQGKFTDGDPLHGIRASIASAEHMNAVYDELINVITFAGITPAVNAKDQLKQALEFYRNASHLNAGTVAIDLLPSSVSVVFNELEEIIGQINFGSLSYTEKVLAAQRIVTSYNYIVTQYAGGNASLVGIIKAGESAADHEYWIANNGTTWNRSGASGVFNGDFDTATGFDSGLNGTLGVFNTNLSFYLASEDRKAIRNVVNASNQTIRTYDGSKRSLNVEYTNTDTEKRSVTVSVDLAESGISGLQFLIDGVLVESTQAYSASSDVSVSQEVMPSEKYEVRSTGIASFGAVIWSERGM